MLTRFLLLAFLVGLLFVFVSCMAQPPTSARAQGFVTPTPLPAIVATQQAASQLQANARNQAATAAEYQRLADETRRNAAAQEAAAQQAISDARAASAAQNAGAVGEAIGRAESELNQLMKTNQGQGEALNLAGDVIRAQASTIMTLTNETESLRARVRDLNVAYQAAQVQQVDATRNGTIGNIAASFAFLSAGALLAWLVMGVLQRRHDAPLPSVGNDVVDATPFAAP